MGFPLLFLKPEMFARTPAPIRKYGTALASLRPSLQAELDSLDLPADATDYATACIANAALTGLAFFLASFSVLAPRGVPSALAVAAAYFSMFFAVSLAINLFYPKIVTNIRGESVDEDLPFALREMALRIEGGIPLYDAMVDVSESDFGEISREFAIAVHEINSGYSEKAALERMAVRTKSEFLKKTLWQITSALSSGASLAPALKQVADTIKAKQLTSLKDYSSSLGFLVWFYLILAIVMPAMGITFIIVYAAFSKDLEPLPTIYAVVAASVVMQVVIVGYINRTKPKVTK